MRKSNKLSFISSSFEYNLPIYSTSFTGMPKSANSLPLGVQSYEAKIDSRCPSSSTLNTCSGRGFFSRYSITKIHSKTLKIFGSKFA